MVNPPEDREASGAGRKARDKRERRDVRDWRMSLDAE